jgi:FAD-linked oxidoreductase
MKNWAGNIEFNPKEVTELASVDDISSKIKKARAENRKIRMRGTGHSWTELIVTDDIFVHLDSHQGIVGIDKENKLITVNSGTKISDLGEAAFKHGLAMENQGDIDKQSIAGAASTGTHGTGVLLQSVSNQIAEMSVINGLGERVVINPSHPAFHAARVSLGSLGVIDTLTLKMAPSYKLKVKTFPETFEESLKAFPNRVKDNRHLEMFYFPVGGWSLTKIMNKTEDPVTPNSFGRKFNDVVLENWLYTQLNRLAKVTGQYRGIDKLMRAFVSAEEKVDWSHRAFPTTRSFKFMEMEYNLPIEKFQEVIEEMREKIKFYSFETLFPIEIRFVKNDNIWLSPAYGRDSVYFAVHTYISESWQKYFNCMEEIFRRHGGRPHWGKWHSMNHHQFSSVYPKFEDFKKIRHEFDPEQVFINPHLKSVFGL